MLKFMYNGIKLNGELFKAHYSIGSIRGCAEGTITIYAREYTSFPYVEGLQVQNDSDSMTDYFEKDRIRVTPDSKYYNEVLAAYNKQELHRNKRNNKAMGTTETVVEVIPVIVEEIESAQQTISTTEGVTVEFNEEKNGIEISFASKELATEEIRTAIKSVGFRYFAKFQKWICKQTPEAIELVNTLFSQQEQIQEVVAEVETIETIKPYSKDILKYVNSICETIVEMDWELQEIKIIDDNGEPCIYGLVKKSNGLTEWEGLYAPSYERTELQDVFNCLNSRIVKDITIDGMEELKELSTLQEVPTNTEVIDNTKLIIFIEGEGNTPELKTNDIIKATENLNDRIMKEYNSEYGGYSKTWITLTLNGNNYRFRYDIDNTMRLTTNIIKFMLEQETAEYNYTMKNIDSFSWLNPEEYKKEALETIEFLDEILSENDINITIDNDPFQRALNTIEDNNLYEVSPSDKTVIADNRYIKNIACNGLTVVTGHTIRELLQEGQGVDVINLKPLKML